MKWLNRSEEHTSELQSRGLISYAVFCLKKTLAALALNGSRNGAAASWLFHHHLAHVVTHAPLQRPRACVVVEFPSVLLFFKEMAGHRALHSYPTPRSSD